MVRQLDKPPPIVEVILANHKQTALFHPADPAENSRGRDFRALAHIADRVPPLQDVGFEQVKQDVPGGSGKIVGTKQLAPKIAKAPCSSDTMLQRHAGRHSTINSSE
jgi:hypothetical protein